MTPRRSASFSLGHFEQLLLLALVRLGDNAYGMALRDEIDAETGRAVSLGMVYKTLWRLEEKGLISSRLSDPTARRGGRRKRLYVITNGGRHALRSSLDTVRRLSRGVEKALARR
jgi:DNA-binding PadR family transcriptional regulator